MRDICDDLLRECSDARMLCGALDTSQWQRRTDFYGWTPWDEIAHLAYFDEAALKSVRDAEAFKRSAAAVRMRLAAGEEISAIAREAYRAYDGPALLERWSEATLLLNGDLAKLKPEDRLTWYGPPMSARSFATARIMETWAHSQDIWDALGRHREPTSRLKHIAHLGVSTFKWTFINRRLPLPENAPYVRLTAPDGKAWEWGSPATSDAILGAAEDFCLVVTQRRHVTDTALACSSGVAQQWMEVAQCFAGEPATGPLPGARKTRVQGTADRCRPASR